MSERKKLVLSILWLVSGPTIVYLGRFSESSTLAWLSLIVGFVLFTSWGLLLPIIWRKSKNHNSVDSH